jgi:hypothetical protein
VFVVGLWLLCRVCFPYIRRGKSARLFQSPISDLYCFRSGLHPFLLNIRKWRVSERKTLLSLRVWFWICSYLFKKLFKYTRLLNLLRLQTLPAVVTFPKPRRKSNCVYRWPTIYVCENKGAQPKLKLHQIGTRFATAWPLRCLCYRPAVVFHHLRPIALLFLQGKKFSARKNVTSVFLLLFKNCVS